MSWQYPWVLLLIPPALWLLRRQRDRTSVTVNSVDLWPATPTGKGRFLWLPPSLRLLAVTLLLVALAQPQAGSTYNKEVTEGIAIQLLVDVSSSMDMNALDIEGKHSTRMEIAKDLVERFIAGDGEKLQGRPHDLIGLITFARYADTRSPLTFGHNALLQIVRQLDVQERPNEDGTAYGDALAIAAARLKNPEALRTGQDSPLLDKIESRVIILLTDGENNSGNHLPIEAAGLAKAWDCRIYTISFGSSFESSKGTLQVDPLSAAEKVLEHISQETGGIFRRAHDYKSLLAVYAEIDGLVRSEIATRSFDRVTQWFWLPLAIAIVALFAALTLEATWLRVVP